MAKISLSAQMVVKNEQNWVWYAIMSVIDWVDEILVCDTGSTDRTVDIIKTISDPKIKLQLAGPVDRPGVTTCRQQLFNKSSADWIMILDGDEIWADDSISQTVKYIHTSQGDLEYLIHPYHNCLGDVYHFQDPLAGRYRIGTYSGNVTIRFVNRRAIPGLHFSGQHGHEGLVDKDNVLIQDRQTQKTKYLDLPYLHTTHLSRTPQPHNVFLRSQKYKYELGQTFSEDFLYPKPFYLPTPKSVPLPWNHRDLAYLFQASWQTPLKILKRQFRS